MIVYGYMTDRIKNIKEGNVVKSLIIGNTKIKICDDYCRDKTPAEVQEILSRIAIRAQMHLSACYAMQNKEKSA